MKARDQEGLPYGIAVMYCGLQDKDQALTWLGKACRNATWCSDT